MDEDTFKKIFDEHQALLKHTDEEGKKVIICFSAISGAGKTTIAKHLEKELSAVRISTDDIRSLIQKHKLADKPDDIHKLTDLYLAQLCSMYPWKNHCIILYADISRRYDELHTLLTPQSWCFFIIQITIPPEIAEERVKSRDTDADWFAQRIAKQVQSFTAFQQIHDMQFTLDYTEISDLSLLTDTVKTFLKN